MNKLFFLSNFLSLLCSMITKPLVQFIVISLLFASCKSEYEERFQKAKQLKYRLMKIKTEYERLGISANQEIEEIKTEIHFHARVSGNQDLFLRELHID